MIIMAASKGQQALDRLGDNDPVPNGLFTRELVKQMRQPGLSAGEMLKRVRANVESAALAVKHVQRPSLVDESSSDFFFYPGRGGAVSVASAAPSVPAAPAAAPGTPAAPSGYAPQREFDAWEAAGTEGSRAAYEQFMRQFPDGRYVVHAKARIAALSGGAVAAQPSPVNKPVGKP
jgi:hypothetical protein